MLRRFVIAAGPNVALSSLTCATSMLMGRPLYLPVAFAFALPLQHDFAFPVATRTVSINLLVGLRVSSFSPPMLRITRPIPCFVRSASMVSNSAVLRASLSGVVIVSKSPSQETLGELDPLGDAADLFAENPFCTRGLQVARLGVQPGCLIRCAGARIPYVHHPSPPCPVCIYDNARRSVRNSRTVRMALRKRPHLPRQPATGPSRRGGLR
jgi:hypothetical protein